MSRIGNNISEEKAKRIAVGATVAGVLLIVFLLVIAVCGWVQIAMKRAKLEELTEQTQQYEELRDDQSKKLDWLETPLGLYYAARYYFNYL